METNKIFESNKRNSNIELLRIILMLMVILLHFNNSEMGGGFKIVENNLVNNYILHFFESLSICAVNCFMIISGFFLAYNKKVKTGKIFDLLFIVIFYNFFDFFISLFVCKTSFSLKGLILCLVPGNYFAVFYIVTYLFSPYLVKIFDNINSKQQNQLIILLLLVFTIPSTIINMLNNQFDSDFFNRISTVSSKGDIDGYSIVQFLIAFIIGIWLRRNTVIFKSIYLLLSFLIISILITPLSFKDSSVYSYSSIFTLLNATLLFLLFNNFKIESKFINFVSKSVFSIFCIHTSGSALFLWRKYFISDVYLNNNLLFLIFWTLLSVISMFIFCFIIDIIVRGLCKKIRDFIIQKSPELINLNVL